MAHRIDVSATPKVGTDGVAHFILFDRVDGQPVSRVPFSYGDGSEAWVAVNRRIAQSVADAMNAAPQAAFESLRQNQRMASQMGMRIERRIQRYAAAA